MFSVLDTARCASECVSILQLNLSVYHILHGLIVTIGATVFGNLVFIRSLQVHVDSKQASAVAGADHFAPCPELNILIRARPFAMSAVTKARVLWNRLPTYFPNIKLVMYPLSATEQQKLARTGSLPEVRPEQLCVKYGFAVLTYVCDVWEYGKPQLHAVPVACCELTQARTLQLHSHFVPAA